MQTTRKHDETARWAFSRLDLVVTIAAVACLLAWFGLGHWGENGHAMADFAAEHDDGLPAARIDLSNVQISWDSLVVQYLNLRSVNRTLQYIACPSDSAPRTAKPRSYAMGGNDMTEEHWPPGPDSATGVGLCWDNRSVLSFVNSNALQKLELLPALKVSAVPAPADTLLLTEFVDPNNTLGGVRQTTVSGTSQQQQFFDDGGAQFHHGKFNYLMVDGHVELLTHLQTGSYDGTAGIWTLKKGN